MFRLLAFGPPVLFLLMFALLWFVLSFISLANLAFARSHQQRDYYRAFSSRWLGISLLEPLINGFFVLLLLLTGLPVFIAALFGLVFYIVLLSSLFPRNLRAIFGQATYRSINLSLLRLGLMRWFITTALILLLPTVAPIALLFWLANVWYLKRSAASVLNGPLALQAAPAPGAPGSGRMQPYPFTVPANQSSAASVQQAARPATAAPMVTAPQPPAAMPAAVPAAQVQPAAPSDLSVLCPVCATPASLLVSDCPNCGLLFASRVPASLHTLPDYTVLRPLGDGGMSSVYLARQCGSQRLCVLKTLASVEQVSDPHWRSEATRCLRSEYDLLTQLDHPHIARVLAWVRSQQGEFLVLEYVPGLTLEQRLTRSTGQGGSLPLDEVLRHGICVAGVLEHLASLPQPVLHHDIKPGNLIVRPDDARLMLVDFGSAVLAPAEDTRQTARLDRYGTPGYAAPEQYQGTSSPASDVYGLAATLYHLLTDDDPTTHPLSFPQLDALPAAVGAVLRPALAHNPQARPSARQFRRQLARLQTLPANQKSLPQA